MNVNKTEFMITIKESRDMLVTWEHMSSNLKQVEGFKYLGSTMSQKGGCEVEVESMIKASWGKWKEYQV